MEKHQAILNVCGTSSDPRAFPVFPLTGSFNRLVADWFGLLHKLRAIDTPDSPSPVSVIAPASVASLARSYPTFVETKIRKELTKKTPVESDLLLVTEEPKMNCSLPARNLRKRFSVLVRRHHYSFHPYRMP